METKDRILEAAAIEFAERGFHGATIALIIHRAGVNQAAVNYHFGGKAKLYAAVIRRAMGRLLDLRGDPLTSWRQTADPLEALVRGMLSENLIASEERDRIHRLFVWEGLRASGVAEVAPVVMMDRHFRSVAAVLAGEIGCGESDDEAMTDAIWVIGQCHAFGRDRALRSHLPAVPPEAEAAYCDALVSRLLPRIRAGLALTRADRAAGRKVPGAAA
ncbi:TetR/AcrR family transcriptional regulator [Rhodospirillum rubrum]|uniref:Transcriptional regulator, TetR family n=1 Tax=Rhodospirillum rubrum (strain ATCC 11170 / ATH 1.1.1 / DSM 467 / LMG 4362 / NCIMB 8255 / S1) TaxID=269796 RepID=Q2RQD5_RHORT|nr:TetR/AcrR family transcriptional regulator [Rhodospirillum rubrum]ABC23660.1 transcriptional regulator, TetR family [Rhodospirillum rubrum ATCC 11170]AEO49398.1 TetR family transcriptional regulator [Rhodospirillum rubrum F11]MBK5955336.1 TetR family transcriptional regulator [Rhodospirillum rubrum]QXG79620.1 TetR/AcrR family transcriptional regulator [Rhodospirillum rubrum]HAQ00746.1 TetR/AcrR family transcriptional regulator [Rhodospirillum rubrum]